MNACHFCGNDFFHFPTCPAFERKPIAVPEEAEAPQSNPIGPTQAQYIDHRLTHAELDAACDAYADCLRAAPKKGDLAKAIECAVRAVRRLNAAEAQPTPVPPNPSSNSNSSAPVPPGVREGLEEAVRCFKQMASRDFNGITGWKGITHFTAILKGEPRNYGEGEAIVHPPALPTKGAAIIPRFPKMPQLDRDVTFYLPLYEKGPKTCRYCLQDLSEHEADGKCKIRGCTLSGPPKEPQGPTKGAE